MDIVLWYFVSQLIACKPSNLNHVPVVCSVLVIGEEWHRALLIQWKDEETTGSIVISLVSSSVSSFSTKNHSCTVFWMEISVHHSFRLPIIGLCVYIYFCVPLYANFLAYLFVCFYLYVYQCSLCYSMHRVKSQPH